MWELFAQQWEANLNSDRGREEEKIPDFVTLFLRQILNYVGLVNRLMLEISFLGFLYIYLSDVS